MRSHRLHLAIGVGALATLWITPSSADERLTLSRARELTLERNPALTAYRAEIRARDAEVTQAGRLPNPELRTDLENVGGTGDREGVEQTETTVRVVQRIELGGKRSGRQRIAALEQDGAASELEIRKRALLSETTKAFMRALAAQERVGLTDQLEEIARQAVAGVGKQVEAGAAPEVEVTRARVVLGRNEIEKYRAQRELDAARRALAVSWGDEEARFGALAGDLDALTPPPGLEAMEARLEQNPELVRADVGTEEQAAVLALERAGRIPDVTVGAGARHFADNDDFALVVELSAPIPVFNRNDGAIAAAQHRLDKARADTAAVRLSLRAALAAAHADLSSAYTDASHLRERVIPTAQRAFDQSLQAYHRGLFSYGEVLDTQRTFFTVRGDYLTALESFHTAAAEIERLTGAPLVSAAAEEGR